jgi:hypothetical protein
MARWLDREMRLDSVQNVATGTPVSATRECRDDRGECVDVLLEHHQIGNAKSLSNCPHLVSDLVDTSYKDLW